MTTIHCVEDGAIPVNAYLVETATGVVAIDGTLSVSGGRALRRRAAALGKPLAGVLVTHAHPDHYGGIVELVRGPTEVPIYAATGVARAIRRDDPAKEEILRPMFGDEWPPAREFPNRAVDDAQTVVLAGARFRLVDLGPGESPHDSLWIIEGDASGAVEPVFCGDLAYGHMHAYLADGHYEAWLANLERVRSELPPETTYYVGHGEAGGVELLDWQEGYIRAFLDAVRAASDADDDAATREVTEAMKEYLPADNLLFLMQLSVPAVRRRIHAGR